MWREKRGKQAEVEGGVIERVVRRSDNFSEYGGGIDRSIVLGGLRLVVCERVRRNKKWCASRGEKRRGDLCLEGAKKGRGIVRV